MGAMEEENARTGAEGPEGGTAAGTLRSAVTGWPTKGDPTNTGKGAAGLKGAAEECGREKNETEEEALAEDAVEETLSEGGTGTSTGEGESAKGSTTATHWQLSQA